MPSLCSSGSEDGRSVFGAVSNSRASSEGVDLIQDDGSAPPNTVRSPPGIYVKESAGSGYILLAEDMEQFDAHCETCGAAIGRKYIRFARAKSERMRAQGRPLGLQLCWLVKFDCQGDQDAP